MICRYNSNEMQTHAGTSVNTIVSATTMASEGSTILIWEYEALKSVRPVETQWTLGLVVAGLIRLAVVIAAVAFAHQNIHFKIVSIHDQ